MGEYAEMMLDGTCCSSCGEYLGSNNGYATQCSGCGSTGNRAAPSGKMGKKTKHVLIEMHRSKKQTETNFGGNSAQIYSLERRGFARPCKRYGFYELTDEGHAEAERRSKSR